MNFLNNQFINQKTSVIANTSKAIRIISRDEDSVIHSCDIYMYVCI